MGLSTMQVDENILDLRLLERSLEVPEKGTDQQIKNGSADYKMLQQQPPLKCPRCDSINTKFCYYNNYSRLQPRYFCKACRRHWTAGGTLRNVPLGGSRKNKRSSPKPSRTLHHQQQETALMKPFFDGLILNGSIDLPETNRTGMFFHLPEAEAPPPELEMTSLALPLAEDYLNNSSSTSLHSFSSSSSTSFDDQEWGAFKMEINPAMVSSWRDDEQQAMHQFPKGPYLSCWDDILDLVDLELKTASSSA